MQTTKTPSAFAPRVAQPAWTLLPSLFFAVLRSLYGVAWMLAGLTKESEKHWFSEPGIFLRHYLLEALEKPNVPEPYRQFLQGFVLEHVLFFNYAIPISQVIAGTLIVFGLLTLPMLLVCLFMHVNFVLSGNMNDISLVLYTTAFLLLLGWRHTLAFSTDALLRASRTQQHPVGSPTTQFLKDAHASAHD
ncbi:hypothetical protein [Deinococcus peraridilitoris]|uniref:DoxX protein n=1 Tax=Deinococcus peraridilitoris (strain DSM 19664 / LMG 22246 / CIP 109416 / KR-200) TaxID=937777 RepID=L0A8B3_DEIPD|nr:hypothetical protein [Deinococcus peraridilitoris]AFZ69654.1 hypothetical protein Deipe_4313 [Deinococcus peraridilitoris DSM 19664]